MPFPNCTAIAKTHIIGAVAQLTDRPALRVAGILILCPPPITTVLRITQTEHTSKIFR